MDIKLQSGIKYLGIILVLNLMIPGVIFSMDDAFAAGILYSVSPRDNILREIDPSTSATLSSILMTLDCDTPTGLTGLATDPTTGKLYGIFKVNFFVPDDEFGPISRVLAEIDPGTGTATCIKPVPVIAGIAFDSTGKLFGVSGKDTFPRNHLYDLGVSPLFTPTIPLCPLPPSSGVAIALAPSGSLFYATAGTYVEITDTATCSVSALLPPPSGPPRTMTFSTTAGVFLFSNPVLFFELTTTGTSTSLPPLDHRTKGLAFVPPPDADKDGVPDDFDLCSGTPMGTPVDPLGCPLDTTPPVIIASLVPICGEDDEGLFTVVFSATDDTAVDSVIATLNGIPVEDGQIVELELDDKDKSKLKHGILKIKSSSFSLDVTAVDSLGNAATLSVIPSFSDLEECEDKDDEKDDKKDHDDEKDDKKDHDDEKDDKKDHDDEKDD